MKEIIIDKEFYEKYIKKIVTYNCLALTSFMIMLVFVFIALVFLMSGILLGYTFNTIFSLVSLFLAVCFFISFYQCIKEYHERRKLFIDYIKSLSADTFFKFKI